MAYTGYTNYTSPYAYKPEELPMSSAYNTTPTQVTGVSSYAKAPVQPAVNTSVNNIPSTQYVPIKASTVTSKKTPAQILQEKRTLTGTPSTNYDNATTSAFTSNNPDADYNIRGKLKRQEKIDQMADLRESAYSYGMSQAQVNERVNNKKLTEAQKLRGSGTRVYENNLLNYITDAEKGAKGEYIAGSGVAKEGQTIGGKTVIDTNKLGIGFDTRTGAHDKVRSGSGFTIESVQYQIGTDGEGKPIYAYAPTVVRQAFNVKLGGMVGTGTGEDSTITGAEQAGRDSKTRQVTYTDARGNVVTTTLKPKWTKEGKAQREEIANIESQKRDNTNKIIDFQSGGRNLYDWITSGGNEQEWDAAQKYLAEKNKTLYNEPDRTDPDYWIELNENSLTGDLAEAKRTKEKQLADVQTLIDNEVARRIANIGDVDDATRKAMEEQIRTKVAAKDEYNQMTKKVEDNYNEWKSENQYKIANAAKLEYERVKAARAKDEQAAQDEIEQIAAEKKARTELEGLYPDLELTDEQVAAYAKAQRTQDPAEQAAAQKLMQMQANGEIKKGSEIIDSMSVFKDPASAKKYWSNQLPAWEVTKQMNKYFEDMGYEQEVAKEKVELMDMYDYVMGNVDNIPENTQEAMADIMRNDPYKYGKLQAMIAAGVDAKAKGVELSWQDILDAQMTYDAEQNFKRGEIAGEPKGEKPKETSLEKLKTESPALYEKAQWDADRAIAMIPGGSKMTYKQYLEASANNADVQSVTLFTTATGQKEPSKYVLEAIKMKLDGNAGGNTSSTNTNTSSASSNNEISFSDWLSQ